MATTTYDSGSGTFTVPTRAFLVQIELWGPGARGTDGGTSGSSGGGAGAYCLLTQYAAAGTNISYSVSGTEGVNTTCTTYSLIAGSGVSSAGGSASGGTVNTSGNNGDPASGKTGGNGGASPNGGAGGAGGSSGDDGGSGVTPGGGGGGGGKNGSGGYGATGRIKFTYSYLPNPSNFLMLGIGS